MKILILNNWHEGMEFFFSQHINHNEHQVWYLCDKASERAVENYLSADQIAGHTTIEDFKLHQELMNVAEHIHSEFAFDRVIAIDELTVLEAAMIRERFDVHGPKVANVLPYRDKNMMKEVLANTPVKTIEPIDIEQVSRQDFVPLVIKPLNDAAAQGVVICRSYDEFMAVKDDIGDRMVERFISGPSLYVDGLFNEQGAITVANRYIGNCYDHFNHQTGLGGVSINNPDLLARIQTLTEQVVSALPLDRGIFHLELIHNNDDQLYFLEIACRVGGAESHNITNDVYGIDLIEYHIKSDLGEQWSLPKKRQGLYSGMLMLNSFPDKDRNYLGYKGEVLSKENKLYKVVQPLFGRPMNTYDGVNFCFKSDKYEDIERSIEEVREKFTLL